MKQSSCKLTVLFQNPFWVGIFEEECEKGIGTKAQNAIKIQHEEAKVERIKKRKERKEEERDRMYELKQMKKKEKHKGH